MLLQGSEVARRGNIQLLVGVFPGTPDFPWIERLPEVDDSMKSCDSCEGDEVIEIWICIQGWDLLPRIAPKVSRGSIL